MSKLSEFIKELVKNDVEELIDTNVSYENKLVAQSIVELVKKVKK